MRDFRIDGIVPIIPTPFFADDTPDWESLRGLIGFAHARGCCAICLPAYASEFYKLSEGERREAVARAVEYAAGRIPVIAQVNFATPHMVIDAAAVASGNGANCVRRSHDSCLFVKKICSLIALTYWSLSSFPSSFKTSTPAEPH